VAALARGRANGFVFRSARIVLVEEGLGNQFQLSQVSI
jgi:hypothetical protein